MMVALYNCITVPLIVTFEVKEVTWITVINNFADAAFMVDIGLNFFTTYINSIGEEVTDLRKIALHYLRLMFWIDLVSAVPFDLLLLIFSSSLPVPDAVNLTDMIELVRVFRLNRMIRFLRSNCESKSQVRLLIMLTYLMLWIHFAGCAWYSLARLNGDWSPVPTWAYGDYDIYSKYLMTRYIYSVYHGMWCLRGNELGTRDSTMAAAGGFLMIFGAMITAILFGEIAVIMTVLTRRSTQFQNTIENGFMTANELQLPSTLTTKILDYVTSSKAQLSMQNEFDYFSRLISPSLQSQVSSCLYGPLLEKNAALASSPQAAQVIIKRLKQRLFKPEEVVVTEGTVSDSMYFVLRGELSVWVSDPLKESKLICYLGEGAHFGEVGLVYKTLRTAAVISQDFSTVAQLMETDFNEVTTKFPVLIESLRKATDLYEDPWKLYIIEGFTQAAYYKYLPRSTMQECVYLAEVEWIKPGDYLFRPGDKADRAYLVTEGLLELSFTFNDVNLHRLKRTNHILKIEHTPPLQRRRYSAIEFSDWDVDLVSCSLKSCYEVMPLINDTGVVGSKLYGESHEVPLKPLGEYPQEVILEQFEGGVLLNSNLLIMFCTNCSARPRNSPRSTASAVHWSMNSQSGTLASTTALLVGRRS
jgi:CRP-like cAMP-binding protein